MTMFYRCHLCHSVLSPWDLKQTSCPVCGGSKVSPTNLTIWEKIVQIAKNLKRIRKVPGKFELQFDE